MKLTFRRFPAGNTAIPRPGEMFLQPRSTASLGRRDLASLVLESGLEAFPRGEGPIEQLVLNADPTLDDLLAAAFIGRLLAGAKLPAGCKEFARYAALAREGLRPGEVAPEVSQEGIFLALRNAGSGDLTDPAVAARFAGDWSRMAACIFEAAETGTDPFTTSLFASRSEFAREKAFLSRDHEVFRQDILRGEQWLVRIPGGPPQAAALLLRQPRSLLFKYWSRRNHPAPGGEAFVFLAVAEGERQWVFSTDPVHRLSLKPLAAALQAAEATENPAAPQDPWFDGKPFGHTLVAAPRGGTVLSESAVLGVVRRWTRARRHGHATLSRKVALGAALACSLLIAVGLAWHFRGGPSSAPLVPDGATERGVRRDDEEQVRISDATSKGALHLVAIGVSKYRDGKFDLEFGRADAEGIAEAFQKHGRNVFDKVHVKVLTDQNATREGIVEELVRLKVTQRDLVIVTLAGHGAHLDHNQDFFFLPYDFDDSKDSKRATTGVYWDDFKRHLGNLPCRVLLIVDTCHSGTITSRLRSVGAEKAALSRGARHVSQSGSGNGLIVMAACLGSGKAQERKAWGHGALTLALIEGVKGRHLYEAKKETMLPKAVGPEKVISLKALDNYITDRVAELAGADQAVVTNHTGDIPLSRIPISSLAN